MTETTARQPKGVPVGGQFAATAHTETHINLTAPRRPELEGWPESLPDPEVSVHMGDDNVITTTVAIDGESVFEVWNPGDDVHSTESSTIEHPAVADEDIHAAAEAWAKNKHDEIAGEFRTELHSAYERSKARILAKATGTTTPLGDEDLGTLVGLNQSAAYTARRDAEMASVAVIARSVLKDHPDAHHLGLRVDSADNGEFVSGAVIYDAEGRSMNSLSSYDSYLDDDEEYAGAGVTELFSGLEADPDRAFWADLNTPVQVHNDRYTIDLAKAAAWTPGAEA